MILIGTDDGIYRWFEGGGWPIFHGLQGRAITGLTSPAPGCLVAIDRTGAVLESISGGIDWRELPLPSSAGKPSAVAAYGSVPTVVVALRPLSIYTRPFGAPIPRPPLAPEAGTAPTWVHHARRWGDSATQLVVPRRHRRAADHETARLGGWVPTNTPHPPRSTVAPEARLICPAGSDGSTWLIALVGAGLWRSSDRGRGWVQVAGLGGEVHAIKPVRGTTGLWAATSDGCRYSADGGQTWEDRSSGLEAVRNVTAIAVNPADANQLYAGVAPPPAADPASPRTGLGYSLFESSNAGKTWTRIVKRNFPEDLGYDSISDIAFDPAAPANVVVALGSGELWVTRNAGAYWGPLARQIHAARVLTAIG